MTEAGWVGCAEPRETLDSFPGRANDRKWQLFAIASCCRRTRESMSDDRSRKAVDVNREQDGVIPAG
jgi:hypothetical protein